MSHQKGNPVILAYNADMEDQFMVYEDYSWTLKNGQTIKVAEGYLTDLASIPRIARSIIKGHNRYTLAAIVHDYLCTHGDQFKVNRKRADDIFLEIMLGCEVPKWKAYSMYGAVRAYAILSGKDQ